MNEDNFLFDFRENPAPEEQQTETVEQQQPETIEGSETLAPEGGQELEQQTQSMEELLARIAELESSQQVVERIPQEALAILQDKNALKELAKDYETMPIMDLLKEEFFDKNQKVLASNPDLDVDMAFRRFLQKTYNADIEPAIDENFGLDEYDYALLKSQVDELRDAKIQKQASLQSALRTAPSSETDSAAAQEQQSVNGEDEFQQAMREYEQRLNSYVETGLKNISPSAPVGMPDGIQLPAIGEDVLRNMINTLSAEQLPLIVADDNNVYPNLSLLRELAEYRELQKNLPQMLASYKEKIVAEAYENIKKGIANKADTSTAPSNPYTGDIISPPNMGQNIITGFKF
jgi:hypothetical protein